MVTTQPGNQVSDGETGTLGGGSGAIITTSQPPLEHQRRTRGL